MYMGWPEDARKMLINNSLEADNRILALSDTLDVKAGLLLAMLTFLGLQVGEIFTGNLGTFERYAERISVLALVIGGLLAIIHLWPRNYKVPPTPRKSYAWIDDVEKHFANQEHSDEKALHYIETTQLSQAFERIEANNRLNGRKERLMEGCFVCVALSFAANLAVIVSRHLF
jgi:hypothetical protein